MDRFGHMTDYDGFSIFSHLETVKPRKMEGSEAILLCWRTMPLRGLGPKGARVVHYVCIVRQF